MTIREMIHNFSIISAFDEQLMILAFTNRHAYRTSSCRRVIYPAQPVNTQVLKGSEVTNFQRGQGKV